MIRAKTPLSRMTPLAAMAAMLLAQSGFAAAPDPNSACADRAAIERVYHEHRLGTKLPFEQAMPNEMIAKLVCEDRHKEALLRKVYGVEIAATMIEAEVRRIESTTRAPEILAEIKAALGNDATRFADSFAKPLLVERELRSRFDTDNKLHAAKRGEAEQARANLLAGKSLSNMQEMTWQLTPRPEDGKAPTTGSPPQTKASAKSGAYSVEATAQLAQPLTPPDAGQDRKAYFDDLDPELQKVLRVQLQKPGNVSAVIETPGAFLVFQAREKSDEVLGTKLISFSKRSYETWLAEQPEAQP